MFLTYLRYYSYLHTYERASVLDDVTQVVSIPELKPAIKESRNYVMVCRNCGERILTAPRRRSNEVVYDSSIKVRVVCLSVVKIKLWIIGKYLNFAAHIHDRPNREWRIQRHNSHDIRFFHSLHNDFQEISRNFAHVHISGPEWPSARHPLVGLRCHSKPLWGSENRL